MAAPYDPSTSRLRLSTTEGGVYNIIGKVRQFDMTEGEEGGSTIYWFGGDQARAGLETMQGTIPVWWDLADTTGQDLLRASKRAGTYVWLQFCPEGTTSGAPFEQFEAIITEVSRSSSADSDTAVEGSFSFRGSPSTLTTGTLV